MENHNHGSYARFFAMIGTAMVAMYIFMYSHTYQIPDHVWFSETRLFLTLIMGSCMMIIMLFFMRHMYKNSKMNAAIYIGAGLLLVLSIALVRSQTTVSETSYMKAMIPHHSIAILTSENTTINDTRVQDLAQKIIESQRREIKEMEWLINDIQENGLAETQQEAEKRPLPDFSGTPNEPR